ncbi:MAG: amidohydrolase family protein [Acidobacteriota bacterium]|nr:amidohydrolase family protein [Acidobacteriota bacterium]
MSKHLKGIFLKSTVLLGVVWLTSVATVQSQQLPELVSRHGYAETIFINGKIVSMDDTSISSEPGNIYQALAVKRDSIMKLGTNEEVQTLAGEFTQVHDLDGRTMIPGIIEPHSHIYGRSLRYLDRFGVKYPPDEVTITPQAADNLEETQGILRDSIKEAVADMNPGTWLRVNMQPHPDRPLELDLWGDTRRLTNKKTLDLWTPDNPVIVRPGNRGFINSAALNKLEEFLPGYSNSIRDSMHMDEIGEDPAEIGWVGSQEMSVIQWELYLEDLDPLILAQVLKIQSEAFAARGVTTFSSRIQFPKIMTGYAKLAELGQMPIRFSAHYEVHRMPTDPIQTRQLYRRTGVLQGIGNDYFWFDGVASERWDSHIPEACLGDDIVAPPHIKIRETCPKSGDLHWDTLKNALKAGWRLKGVHSVGSESLRRFVQMIDEARAETGLTVEQIYNEHFAVEHCDQMSKLPEIMDKIKEYGIIISCGPNYLETFEALIRDYGEYNDPEHLRKFMLPYKTWIESGVLVVGQHFGGDPAPFYMPWLTMSRSLRGNIWAPEERIDRVRALKLWTPWAARYVMKADKLGTLEEGKWADLVVLDRDYFTIPENDILRIQPLLTMVGGKVISLHERLATEWNTAPVGEEYNYDQEEVDEILRVAEQARPWTGGPIAGSN